MSYTDNEMIQLAQRYLRNVGEFKSFYFDAESLLSHCVEVYNKRKEAELEL